MWVTSNQCSHTQYIVHSYDWIVNFELQNSQLAYSLKLWLKYYDTFLIGRFTNDLSVKVKLSLCLNKHHAMKTYWGVEVWLLTLFHLGTRWKWVVSFTPLPLYPQGNNHRYPLDKRLDEPQAGREEKTSQPPPEVEPRSSDPLALSQSLYRLSYAGSRC
jgi:hypothetical protein